MWKMYRRLQKVKLFFSYGFIPPENVCLGRCTYKSYQNITICNYN